MNISCLTERRQSVGGGLDAEQSLFSTTFPTPRSERRVERKHAQDHSKSMSSFPDYVAKFRSKMVEIRSTFRKTSRMGIYNDYWIPPNFQATWVLFLSLSLSPSASPPTSSLDSDEWIVRSGWPRLCVHMRLRNKWWIPPISFHAMWVVFIGYCFFFCSICWCWWV